MKIFFLFMGALSIFFMGCAGMEPIPEEDLTFNRVVEVPGITKDKLYDQTKMWIAENFKSAKSVIEYDSRESGTIVGNGNIKYPCTGLDCVAKHDWRVHFTMKVDTKDEKFRLTFSNLRLSWPPSYNSTFGYQRIGQNGIRRTTTHSKTS